MAGIPTKALIRLAVSLGAPVSSFGGAKTSLPGPQFWTFFQAMAICLRWRGDRIHRNSNFGSTLNLIPIFVQVVQKLFAQHPAGVMMIAPRPSMVVGFRLPDAQRPVDARVLLAFASLVLALDDLMAGVGAATPVLALIGWIRSQPRRHQLLHCRRGQHHGHSWRFPQNLLASAAGGASFLMQVGRRVWASPCWHFCCKRRNIFHGEHISSAMDEEQTRKLLYQHQQNMWACNASGEPFSGRPISAPFRVPSRIRAAREAMVLAFRDCFLVWRMRIAIVLAFILPYAKAGEQAAQPVTETARSEYRLLQTSHASSFYWREMSVQSSSDVVHFLTQIRRRESLSGIDPSVLCSFRNALSGENKSRAIVIQGTPQGARRADRPRWRSF